MLEMLNPNILIEIMVPKLGTTLGAGCVFLLQGEMPPRMQNILLG